MVLADPELVEVQAIEMLGQLEIAAHLETGALVVGVIGGEEDPGAERSFRAGGSASGHAVSRPSISRRSVSSHGLPLALGLFGGVALGGLLQHIGLDQTDVVRREQIVEARHAGGLVQTLQHRLGEEPVCVASR